MLLALSDSTVAGFITAFFAFLTFCVGTGATIYLRRIDTKAEKAVVKTDQVASRLETSDRKVNQKLDVITLHVNHATEVMLRTIHEGDLFRAETTKLAHDIERAEKSRQRLAEHMRGQRDVDELKAASPPEPQRVVVVNAPDEPAAVKVVVE